MGIYMSPYAQPALLSPPGLPLCFTVQNCSRIEITPGLSATNAFRTPIFSVKFANCIDRQYRDVS